MTNKQAAIDIIRTLRDHGHQAFLAGGCVRDMLIGRAAKDYDVATSARPDEIVKLFRRTLRIGVQFGVVMVMLDSQQVEVATFRTESGYSDGRHPTSVSFSDAEHDAGRRDFTINGMFLDPIDDRVYDYVCGRADLDAKVIRTIGAADERFGEDYLRMLRGVRFGTQLGFDIVPDTWNAICRNASKIAGISSERIATEIEAIVTDPNRVAGFKMLVDSGLFAAIFPEYTSDNADYAIQVLVAVPEKIDFPLAIACVFAGIEPAFASGQLEFLKLSNAHLKHINFLLEHIGVLLEADMSLAKLKQILAAPYFGDLYDFQRAIQTARNLPTESLSKILCRCEQLKGVDLTPKPLLDGHRLIELGVAPGPTVGLVSREMYVAQLNEHLKDTSSAEEWVRQWLAEHGDIG